MLEHKILPRLADLFRCIPLAMALLLPVAAVADPPTVLQPWQERSVLAALQDRSVPVRYAAVAWLSDKQTSNDTLARAVAYYLRKDLPTQVKQGAAQLLGHMGPAGAVFSPQIAALLGDSVEDVRHAAAVALRNMQPASFRAAPVLAALLKDPDTTVRCYAANVADLGQAGIAFAPQVAKLLEEPANDPAACAADSLSRMGAAGAPYARQIAPLLLRDDPFGWVRSHAAQSLARMGPAAVALLPRIAAMLKSTDPHVRADIAADLGDMVGLGSAVTALAPQVAALLRDPDTDPRSAATYALGRMGAAAAKFAPEVAAQLKDPSASVRSHAAQTLGRMGPAAASVVAQLVAALKDPDSVVRSNAAEALGHMGPAAAAAIPQIAALLNSNDAGIRQSAVAAAGALGPSGAPLAPRIVALMKEGQVSAFDAGDALGHMGSGAASVVPQLVALLKDPTIAVSVDAQEALENMGSAAAPGVPEMTAMLSDPHGRYAATQALDGMGPAAAPAAPQLVAILKLDPYDTLTVSALEKMGPKAAAATPQLTALLTDPNSAVRSHAADVLGSVGPAAAAATPRLTALLADPVPAVRAAAAAALGSIGAAAAGSRPRIATLLVDPDSTVRDAAMHALDRLTPFGPLEDRSIVLYCLSASYFSRAQAPSFLLRAYLYREIDRQDLTLIHWLGNRSPAERPLLAGLDPQGALAALKTFDDTWDITKRFPHVREQIAEAIAELAPTQAGQMERVPFLVKLQSRLAPQFPAQALAVQAVLDRDAWYIRLYRSWWLIGTHLCAWILLLFAYPRWRWVQSFFFWNKWARRFFGFFYVGLLITWVPWLRRRMLSPFKESFLPRRILDQLNERAYFPDGAVLLEKNRRTEPNRLPLKEVLQSIRGQIVLKGQSGLGKTLLLLRLAVATKEPVVFLRATECAGGVVAAIQKKVQGQLRDEDYLRTLIYAGALKVLIDGLNEASPDARTRITQFVEEYFKGDFILTTQPVSWEPPATARIYVLQPLLPEQIQPFLLKQWDSVKGRATLDQAQYERAVAQYLQSTAKDTQALLGLSNPMDASLAAELLARGETPDVFHLVEQRYRVMAEEFRQREGREFRLQPFSERVYEWRCSGRPDINIEGFEPEVAALVKDRLMIQRTELIAKKTGEEEINRWFFRHDRIMELFLLPAFMGAHSDRRQQHDLDEQLWGVYELLALRLSDEEEQQLHQFLIERSADTKRNELLNRYTLARRFRTLAHQAAHPAMPSVA